MNLLNHNQVLSLKNQLMNLMYSNGLHMDHILHLLFVVDVLLLGGENWSSINSYSQHGLDSCVFSPSENYIMTSLSQNTTSEKEFFAVWDIASGKKLRNFPRGNYFKWSHDDKYFARMSEDKISIYETPGCALLDKKSLVFKNIDNFEWSPASNVMAI